MVVSSSTDGEGKTTLAVNLALSLATIGMKTILVDGDFRNTEVTRSLCPQPKLGLIEFTCGHVPLVRWDATPQDVALHAIETLSPTAELT